MIHLLVKGQFNAKDFPLYVYSQTYMSAMVSHGELQKWPLLTGGLKMFAGVRSHLSVLSYISQLIFYFLLTILRVQTAEKVCWQRN